MTSLAELDELIRNAVNEYQAREMEDKAEISQKERKLFERRQELFVKNIQGEVQDTQDKIRYFFQVKLQKNWKRINEKLHSQKISAEDF
jgi:hypothetical protein